MTEHPLTDDICRAPAGALQISLAQDFRAAMCPQLQQQEDN